MAPTEYPPSPLRPRQLDDVKVHVEMASTSTGTPKAAGSPMHRGISLLKLSGGGNENVLRKLQSLDRDGDGRLSVAEVEEAVERLVKEESRHRQYKTLAWMVIGLLLFVLLANMGLAYAVAVLAKETTVEGDVMYSKATGRPVEVESSQFTIRNGTMMARHSEQVVETAAATQRDNLTALFSDEYFGQLKSIQITSSEGATANFLVLGFVRMPDNGVNFLTSAGSILMGPDGSYEADSQVWQFLQASGFAPAVTVGSNSTDTAMNTAGRRLLFDFARKCNRSDGRACFSITGDFGYTRQVTCKYGDARGGRNGENCSAFCRGWSQFDWDAAVCFDTHKLSFNAPPQIFPCDDELQCHQTSRGCAPSENTYCCCYDSNRSGTPGTNRDQPGSPSYGR